MSSKLVRYTFIVSLFWAAVIWRPAMASDNPQDAQVTVVPSGDEGSYFPEMPAAAEPERYDNVERMVEALRSSLSGRNVYYAIITRRNAWTRNVPIKVCFRDGTSALQSQVAAAANDWNFPDTPLRLDFGTLAAPRQCPASTSDISVSLVTGISQSPIGAASRNGIMLLGVAGVDPASPKFRQIVLHEFGHALGLWHELKHAGADCWSEFDPTELKALYSREYNITDEARIKAEIGRFDPAQMNANFFSPGYDRASVMMYAFPPKVYRLKEQSKCWAPAADRLSPRDMETLKLAYQGPLLTASLITGLTAGEGADTRKLANALNSLLLAAPRDLAVLERAAGALPGDAPLDVIADAVLTRSQQLSVKAWGIK